VGVLHRLLVVATLNLICFAAATTRHQAAASFVTTRHRATASFATTRLLLLLLSLLLLLLPLGPSF
jgi:hypothetical protein